MGTVRTAAQIRQEFIDFFVQKHGHTQVKSSPVVPINDPTLLFANAGMNQFKDVFLGAGERAYTRAVNSQKCIRAGGKHNDLEDVGKDTYHHTFFEMLGNWSFGDYFKEDAIRWSWELLTEVWGLPKDRLYATVFGGDEVDGTPPDTEAEELWKTVTDIDHSHISRWDKKDNFWEMGETGPCGPCTEIHFDFTEDRSGGPLVNGDDERVIEIWNNVFIEFNRDAKGVLSPLPAKHVDTGMGFERVVRVLQNKQSNYDIDLWIPIFMAIEKHSGAPGYGGRMNDKTDIAYRVIADHMRCLTFAITDGAMPGNEGRGYVLRRILRRAVRMAKQTLNVNGPILHQLVPSVVESMGDAFPELLKHAKRVSDILLDEEESFGRTLDRGLKLFADAAHRSRESNATTILAEDAFKLHDTFGFPIDLTEVMAEERSMTVDLEGYERLMKEARDRARSGGGRSVGSGSGDIGFTGDQAASLKHMHVKPTDDDAKFDRHAIRASIKAIWNGSEFEEHTQSSDSTHLIAVITNRTNFYAEMGGQVGDSGTIRDTSSTAVFEVHNTQIFGGYVLHIGLAHKGKLNVGDAVEMDVDMNRRMPIMANHTGTHLLNHALREVLGGTIDQKGSLVDVEKLRFDYSYNHTLSADQADQITEQVNDFINADLKVSTEVADLASAQSIAGLRAVFGEQYPDPVRVVSVGVPVADLLHEPANDDWANYSIEFCGGTHVESTADILAFEIATEEAVAKGVRRIVAITGPKAVEARATASDLMQRLNELNSIADADLSLQLAELVEEIENNSLPYGDRARLRDTVEQFTQRVKDFNKGQQKAGNAAIVDQVRELAESIPPNRPFIVSELQGANAEALRSGMDVMESKHPESAVLLISGDAQAGKVSIMAKVPDNRIAQGMKAGDWIREVAKVCGGGGGGRPDMAQAGGKIPEKVGEAIERARAIATEVLGAEG